MRLRTAYFLFCFMVLFFAFSLSAEDKGEVEAGTPVMEPGLNAYIMEKGEELFKIEMDTGFRRSTFKFASVNLSKNYFATALNAYINSKGIFDAGLALDLGLAGKDNHYFGLGPRFRLLLNRIPFFEPLYIKWGAMYGSFSNSSTVFGDLVYLKSKGLVISYGGGFHVATGRYSVVSVDYERGSLFPVSMNATVSDVTQDVKGMKTGYPVTWKIVIGYGVRF